MAVKTKTEAPKTSEPRKIDEKDLNGIGTVNIEAGMFTPQAS